MYFIACLVVIALACIPLLPLLALAMILPSVLRIGESILESIGLFLSLILWMLELVAYSFWLLLVGDYARLVRILPEMIDSLRSAGLM